MVRLAVPAWLLQRRAREARWHAGTGHERLGHAKLATRSEAGATIRELAAWSGAHRQTVVRHLVQGRSRFARVGGNCRVGGPCRRSRLVEWKYGRPRCAAAQSARPPTAEFNCDEVWNETCATV